MLKKAKSFIVGVFDELKRVSWPSKEEVMESTLVIIISVIFLTIVIGLLDLAFSSLVRWLLR